MYRITIENRGTGGGLDFFKADGCPRERCSNGAARVLNEICLNRYLGIAFKRWHITAALTFSTSILNHRRSVHFVCLKPCTLLLATLVAPTEQITSILETSPFADIIGSPSAVLGAVGALWDL